MSNYRHISDERMIKACDYVVKHRISDVTTIKEWCEIVGIAPNNITNIKNGKQSFSPEHIRQCCIKFNISANFIYGLSAQLFRQAAKGTPLQKIEQALQELKQLAKKK
jgi:plasmid maintenance system antidote protein VapI